MTAGVLTSAQDVQLQLNASNEVSEVQPTMYGIFFEDINFAADGGLYAEMIKNRSFEFLDPLMGWEQPNSDRHSYNSDSGIAVPVRYEGAPTNRNYCRVTVNNAAGYSMINNGFRGMGVKQGAEYRLSVDAALPERGITGIIVELVDSENKVLAESKITPNSAEWKTYEVMFTANRTEEKAKFSIRFEGTGVIDLDMISLFPTDTWKGRKNGLRKDIVELLDGLNPGFLRFPGGCIVEGRTLEQRYQWKKTVGPVEDREILINRWNTEFSHRLTPDYFQSFGIGFFEYFQLSEDLGAEPLPILSCGMACQFNTGELVPMDELDPYVQDALDLIEFANGAITTTWGKIRNDMGHPEPFDLKYIGVGNEQWGPDYIDRYKVFAKAIKAAYPEMIIVSGSGPFPDGDFFEYGMEELKKLDAEIVDEHYYRSPQWFRENADRYDSYDRNGPKIFAGEYAAQSVAIASPENKNNWECALAEAAFMTGLERNADVVHLTSYAPLMAHVEGWQWTPDLLWFDNLRSYGTPNYYVQKLFGMNSGDKLLKITKGGEAVIGQQEIYASAVKDTRAGEIIIKLVNTASNKSTVSIDISGNKVKRKATLVKLVATDLSAENSLDDPMHVSPVTQEIKTGSDKVEIELEGQSLNVIKLSYR
ncbi:alpha-L-arabinofuranosidase [Robertkochia solimangrovi]|nr:alpha-L-arabinofuranosidase C-terminal domain-containing protein [Robertkochia solimangrovi]TRZ46445.1 alpha-L-arabinofuranosidase [Robertkochia solimangrovi]